MGRNFVEMSYLSGSSVCEGMAVWCLSVCTPHPSSPLAHGHLSVQLPQVLFKSCVEDHHFVPAYSVPFLGSGFLESGGMNDLRYMGCSFASQRDSRFERVQFHLALGVSARLTDWRYVSWEPSLLSWLCLIFTAAGFSLVGGRVEAPLWLWCTGLSLQWKLLLLCQMSIFKLQVDLVSTWCVYFPWCFFACSYPLPFHIVMLSH